jgi:hypothetical protein
LFAIAAGDATAPPARTASPCRVSGRSWTASASLGSQGGLPRAPRPSPRDPRGVFLASAHRLRSAPRAPPMGTTTASPRSHGRLARACLAPSPDRSSASAGSTVDPRGYHARLPEIPRAPSPDPRSPPVHPIVVPRRCHGRLTSRRRSPSLGVMVVVPRPHDRLPWIPWSMDLGPMGITPREGGLWIPVTWSQYLGIAMDGPR